jgi:putative acetyltransferase
MNPHIRPYIDSDLDELLLVWVDASKLAHPFLADSFIEKEKHNIPKLYLPNADTWVQVVNNRVVGFIALLGNEVGALFVDPSYHGKGFGKALMDKARSRHTTLELDVFKENDLGRRFYKRYGFIMQEERLHEDSGHPVLRLLYTS